jgi:hypothetical protein
MTTKKKPAPQQEARAEKTAEQFSRYSTSA